MRASHKQGFGVRRGLVETSRFQANHIGHSAKPKNPSTTLRTSLQKPFAEFILSSAEGLRVTHRPKEFEEGSALSSHALNLRAWNGE